MGPLVVLLLLLMFVTDLILEEGTKGERGKDSKNEMDRRIGSNEESVTHKVIFETTP